MRRDICLLLLASGCIEYEPASTFPPAGVPNDRPLEVVSQTDKLVQVTVPVVDVLYVIDNSGSMASEQASLSTNFPAFMDYFLGSGLDYHIGCTSTDMTGSGLAGKLKNAAGYAWIDDQTVNPNDVFVAMSVLGTGGSSTEKGRDPTYQQIEIHSAPAGANEGFIRDESSVHIVVVSDENDYSVSNRDEFVAYLNGLRPEDEKVTFNSIVSPSPTCPGAAEPGTEYIPVTTEVGGIYWSICNSDWDSVLEQLGLQAAGLKREYFLSQLPVPETIKVWVIEGETRLDFVEGTDWTYDPVRNSVVFETFVPNALSEVYVKYDVLGAAEGA